MATSSGDPEKKTQGKQTVVWSVIAIILAIAFWAIVNIVVVQIMGVEGINEDSIPVNIPEVPLQN